MVPLLFRDSGSERMLDISRNVDPVVLAFLPDREARTREIGILEGTERNGNQPGEFSLDHVMHIRAAIGTEMEADPVAAVCKFRPALGSPFERHLFGWPSRLDGKGASRSFLAVETMTDGDTDRLAAGRRSQLSAAARGQARAHFASTFSIRRQSWATASTVGAVRGMISPIGARRSLIRS